MSKNYNKYNNRKALEAPAPVRSAAPWLAAALIFTLICLCAGATVKSTAVVLILGALAAGCFRLSRLRERVHLPLILLGLYVLMVFLSTLYALSGKFALNEFVKLVSGFAMMLILLALTPGEGETPGRRIAVLLSRVVAIAGLVSIDLLSTRWISGLVIGVLNLFGDSYAQVEGLMADTRMLSLFSNPNVYATIAGVGVLLSLGLAVSSQTEKERRGHVARLFLCALSFVLAFSMGGTAMIVLAFLAYLALETRERRADLFVLMVLTLILTVAAVVPISMTSMSAWTAPRVIPLLCTIAGAALLCLCDRFVGRKAAGKLAHYVKGLLIAITVILAVLAVGIVAAYNLTGPIELKGEDHLSRTVYLEPGEYTISAATSEPVWVNIRSTTEEESLVGGRTRLYRGFLSEAVFTVPDDCLAVYFYFSPDVDVRIERITCIGESGSTDVPLNYILLPDFISNRIQGLFANYDAILRLIYFRDGLRLFQRSPVYGLGLGSFENAVASVQDFYYETKYAHNHYIQTLAETGVIGFALFAGLLVVSAVAVLKKRRREDAHPLTPALGAALVFLAGHALVEVSFSFYASIPVIFCVFGLINLCCGDAIALPRLGKKGKNGILGGIAAVLLAFLVLLCGNLLAKNIVTESMSYDSLERAAEMDQYEWADYMLSYVVSAPSVSDVQQVQVQAAEYAERLSRLNSNTIPYYLAQYYFTMDNVERGMAMLEKYVDYVSGNPDAWQRTFDVLEAYELETEEYRAGVLHLAGLLEERNANSLEEITLEEGTLEFLARLEG